MNLATLARVTLGMKPLPFPSSLVRVHLHLGGGTLSQHDGPYKHEIHTGPPRLGVHGVVVLHLQAHVALGEQDAHEQVET